MEYDMTVRNSKGKIVQFSYGDDNIDTVKVENQKLPLVKMSYEQIYAHFYIPNDNMILYTPSTKKRFTKQKKECEVKVKKYIDYTNCIPYIMKYNDVIDINNKRDLLEARKIFVK